MKTKGTGQTPQGKKHRQKFGLTKPSDVRRMLASIINNCLVDEMQSEKARTVGYLSQILLKAMETSDIEQRLAELEAEVLKKHGKRI